MVGGEQINERRIGYEIIGKIPADTVDSSYDGFRAIFIITEKYFSRP
jgi:hypothetical protein